MTVSFATSPPASSDESGREAFWTRSFLWLLVGLVAFRAGYAWAFPLDLAPDESYYWDWGRRPDIGYFSKPPMIGWLMALAGGIGNNSMFMLKLFPGLLATGGLGFVFLLGRDLFGARAGFWGAATLLATPANAALNTFFTIDAPLFLFWSASLWFAWRWWRAEGSAASGGWAVALAASLGFGYLTKQIQLVFPVLFLAFLVFDGSGRARWRDPRLYAALAVSLLFLVPPLLWNWRHDWITFRHTADELSHDPFRFARSAKFVGEFLGGQAGLGGGISWVLMIVVGFRALVGWRRSEPAIRFLAIFFVPGWMAYACLSTHQRVEQNWAMVFYTSAAVLVAAAAAGPTPTARRWARWRLAGLVMGGALMLALLAVPFVVPATALAGSRSDPTARIRGWRALAERIEPFRRGVPRPDRTFLLAPDDRYVASALAYFLPDQPRTYCWENPRHPESQYGIWGRPLDRPDWDGLVILRSENHPVIPEIQRCFSTWERLGEVEIRLGNNASRDRRYVVFLGTGFRPSP